jgi:S-adenosylmethionine hydrolase
MGIFGPSTAIFSMEKIIPKETRDSGVISIPPSARRALAPRPRIVLPIQSDANTIPCVGEASLVACITDFGTTDFYAGALRGTLAKFLPGRPIVDVTHEIPPGDIRRAAVLLWEVQPAFPKGTVFLAVVDPGVGGARRPAAFSFPECSVVCPDNGIPTFLMERFPEFEAAEIDPQRFAGRALSSTFHGRDIFAPAAARLACGAALSDTGPPLSDPIRIPLPRFQGAEGVGWDGEVMYLDHFGNAVTSIGRISFDLRSLQPWLRTGAQAGAVAQNARVELEDGSEIPLGRTYADAQDRTGRIALVGSNGLLEIASWKSSAGSSPALRAGTGLKLVNPA